MSARNAMHKGRLLVILLLVFGGCARASREEPERARPCEEADAKLVDQVLLAWLSKARTLHHLADLAEDEGSVEKAIARLEQLVGGTMPRGQPPEASEVMADTYARLADLRARGGDYERADQDIASGLKYAPTPTYFRGHLLEVRGLIYEKQSSDLEKAGRTSEAKRAREMATSASLEAVRIQDEVIKSTLGSADGPATRD